MSGELLPEQSCGLEEQEKNGWTRCYDYGRGIGDGRGEKPYSLDGRTFAKEEGRIDEGFALGTYLVGSNFERLPIYSRKNIVEKGGIVFNVRPLKLGVFEMEGKGKGRGLA